MPAKSAGEAVTTASAASAGAGCGILGTGGGGDPYINRLKVLRELDRRARVQHRTPSYDTPPLTDVAMRLSKQLPHCAAKAWVLRNIVCVETRLDSCAATAGVESSE